MTRINLKTRLVVVVVAFLWLTACVVRAQDQLERLRERIDNADQRARTAEAGLDNRLVRIETNLETTGWWIRGVGGAVAINLILKFFDTFTNVRRAQSEDKREKERS